VVIEPNADSLRCPDLTKADEVSAFDFAKTYSLSREAADKLKAATLATIEITQLSEKLDADFGIACAQIALDLGTRGDFHSGSEACTAAINSLHAARQRLGKRAATKLVVSSPVCVADASSMTKCASLCDSSIAADQSRSDCTLKAGRCDGNCAGICEVKSPEKCHGHCTGICEGTMRGSCGGRCKGTCDGRVSAGLCAGTCVGTCGGAMKGECMGQCSGSCESKSPMICDGLCVGTCTVALVDAKCSGTFKTPPMSTDCRVRCELAIMNQTECSSPRVGLVYSGIMTLKEREQAEAMKVAVDKSFPTLLRVLYELGDNGTTKVAQAQAVIRGARVGLPAMARAEGEPSPAAPRARAQLMKCFDEPFKTAVARAAAVMSELDQATAVRDEVAK